MFDAAFERDAARFDGTQLVHKQVEHDRQNVWKAIPALA
jgi:hypothetical protein